MAPSETISMEQSSDNLLSLKIFQDLLEIGSNRLLLEDMPLVMFIIVLISLSLEQDNYRQHLKEKKPSTFQFTTSPVLVLVLLCSITTIPLKHLPMLASNMPSKRTTPST